MAYWNRFVEQRYDVVVIGAGFTGLRTANLLRQFRSDWSVLILERLPIGAAASTRNAGFGCFGTVGEIMDDLQHTPEEEQVKLISDRFKGIQELRSIKGIEVNPLGGYEVVPKAEVETHSYLMNHLERVNELAQEATGFPDVFQRKSIRNFNTNFHDDAIYTAHEFQLNPGLLWWVLKSECEKNGVIIRMGSAVESTEYNDGGHRIQIGDQVIESERLVHCTNGFASQLLPDSGIKPARGQIILTNPIAGNIPIGNFHASAGYYYFRNHGNRILLGGGRQLFKEVEETYEDATSEEVIEHLKDYLGTYILPNKNWEIEYSWSGTMGMRFDKRPLIKALGNNAFVAAGLGGMGVALSQQVAKQLSELIITDSPVG